MRIDVTALAKEKEVADSRQASLTNRNNVMGVKWDTSCATPFATRPAPLDKPLLGFVALSMLGAPTAFVRPLALATHARHSL
jgi:hypothetical protein